MGDQLRQKDFGVQVSTVTMRGPATGLAKHKPPEMTISLPRVRFLDDAEERRPASKRPRRRSK